MPPKHASEKAGRPEIDKLIAEVQGRERPPRSWVYKTDKDHREWLMGVRESYRKQVSAGSEVCQSHLYDAIQENPKTRVPVNRSTFVRWLTEPAGYDK